MNYLSQIKIGSRLAAGFAILLMLLVVMAAMALFQMERLYSAARVIGEQRLPAVELLGEINALVNDVRRTSLAAVLSSDEMDKKSQRSRHDERLSRVNGLISRYEQFTSTPTQKDVIARLKAAWNGYVDIEKQLLTLHDAGVASFSDIKAFTVGDAAAALSTVLNLIDGEIRTVQERSRQEVAIQADNYRMSQSLTIGLMLMAIFTSMAIAIAITRSITRPLEVATQVTERVALGDLSEIDPQAGKDETAYLLNKLREMNMHLVQTIANVKKSSDRIAAAAEEIAAGNAQLSDRTSEQASFLEQTAASIEELTVAVRQNADNSGSGNMLAAQAKDLALEGGGIVSNVVQTMGEIRHSAEQVAQIIALSESIAFQTNILALNAAVEAARAGPEGRGFAVVASEVRTLAKRSADASREIKALVAASVQCVGKGVVLVESAGRAMEQVVVANKQVAGLMADMTIASAEQRSGLEQIGQAVTSLDHVTQQNALLVGTVKDAARALADQSLELNELMEFFKLGNERKQEQLMPMSPQFQQQRLSYVRT